MTLRFNGNRITRSGGLIRIADPPAPSGPVDILVDHTAILHPNADRIGINMNYWEDSDARREPGATPLRNALGQQRTRYARYPGGHKADGVTFFLNAAGATVDTPQARLCRFGAGEWPATDTTYWSSNNRAGSWTRSIYELEEFLDDCAHTGTEPVLVVALDTIANTPTGAGAWTPSKAQIIANAVEMVRWCNVTNDYGVKYWELGNESWSEGWGYAHGYPDAASYGADFADMAQAMKAVDPTILVGMNGHQQQWFEDALDAAGPENVDFLAAHRYPFFGMTYAEYQAIPGPNIVSEANRAANAIATLPEPHKSRLFVMMTEAGYNSQPNNLGAGVVTAHVLGGNLAGANVGAVMLWNTRYAPLGTSHDAFDQANNLTPSGMGWFMASLLAPGAMVSATSSVSNLFAYASYSRAQGRYAVLLVNRSDTPRTVNVRAAGAVSGVRWLLTGTGPSDTAPTITREAVAVSGDAPVSVPANSVVTVVLSKF